MCAHARVCGQIDRSIDGERNIGLVWYGLFFFYGISIIAGYLMPNLHIYYIMRVLIVGKSLGLCRYVQYNMKVLNIYDRAIIIIMIINEYILYIYLINGKYCSATKGFLKFMPTFVRQLRRWNEIENRKCDKIQTKIIKKYILYIYIFNGFSFHLLNCLTNVVINSKKP